MKTLANCTLREFLPQANKIRKKVSEYYESLGIGEIRKRLPKYDGKETPEERKEKVKAQAKQNISDILDSCLEKNVDQTIEVVGLMCFMKKEEAEKMDAGDFLDVVFELLGSERVLTFFTKLVNLEPTPTVGR